jgi:trk system potassium uptake protein TrkH
MPRLRTVLRNLGLVIHVPGLMALATLPICLIFDEHHAVLPFAGTALASLAAGQLLVHSCRGARELELRDAMFVAALAWIVVPLLGAAPFVAIGAGPGAHPETLRLLAQPWNAVFEAFSGFTSTGLTMALRPSELPHALQWWRSFMQWVGGVGVIVLMLSIVRPTISAHRLYLSEARERKIGPSVTSTVRTIWWIYASYTTLGILLLHASGASAWEAVNHGLTAIATGGFTITDGSARSLGVATQLVLLLLMTCGAISFAVHHALLRERRLAALWGDGQHRALWVLLAAGALLLAAENALQEEEAAWLASLFQWVSALCTAGFQTVDLARWSPTAQLLLSAGMVVGGAAGSTAGGIKLVRVIYLSKGLSWRLREVQRSPHEVMRYEVDGQGVSRSEAEHAVEAAGILAFLWLVVLGLSIVVLLHVLPASFSLSEVVLEAASAQGNVGLSTGITLPGLPWLGKLTLILSMCIGRLEIFPVMILLVGPLARRRHPSRAPHLRPHEV